VKDEEKEKCNEGEVVGSVASLDVKRLGGEEVKMKQLKADELGVLVRWTTESRLGYAPVGRRRGDATAVDGVRAAAGPT